MHRNVILDLNVKRHGDIQAGPGRQGYLGGSINIEGRGGDPHAAFCMTASEASVMRVVCWMGTVRLRGIVVSTGMEEVMESAVHLLEIGI